MVLSFPNLPSAMPPRKDTTSSYNLSPSITSQLNQLITITTAASLSQANINTQLPVLLKATENLNLKLDTLIETTATLVNHITNLSSQISAKSPHSSGSKTPPAPDTKPPVKITLPPPAPSTPLPTPTPFAQPSLLPKSSPTSDVLNRPLHSNVYNAPCVVVVEPPPLTIGAPNENSNSVVKYVFGTIVLPHVKAMSYRNVIFHAFGSYGRGALNVYPDPSYSFDGIYSTIIGFDGSLLTAPHEGVLRKCNWRPPWRYSWRYVETGPNAVVRLEWRPPWQTCSVLEDKNVLRRAGIDTCHPWSITHVHHALV